MPHDAMKDKEIERLNALVERLQGNVRDLIAARASAGRVYLPAVPTAAQMMAGIKTLDELLPPQGRLASTEMWSVVLSIFQAICVAAPDDTAGPR